MTSERLYGILQLIDSLDQRLNVQGSLEAIRNALNNLTNQPAQPQFQNALAEALKTFSLAAAKMVDSINPSQFEAISNLGGEEFFDPQIAAEINTSIQTHAMTPSVSRDFVQDLTVRRGEFLSTVRACSSH